MSSNVRHVTQWCHSPDAVSVAVRRLHGDEEDGVAPGGVLVHVGAAGRAVPVAGPHGAHHVRSRLAHHRRHLRDVEAVQLLRRQTNQNP